MLKTILTIMAIISLGTATAAYADKPDGKGHDKGDDPVAAPEMDPAGATSALILLAGGLAVVRGRRGKS